MFPLQLISDDFRQSFQRIHPHQFLDRFGFLSILCIIGVTHGLALRVFVMRFLHLTVEQFDEIANPHNADIITLGPRETIQAPQFVSGRWGVEGLRQYTES